MFQKFSKVQYQPCLNKDHQDEVLSLACMDKLNPQKQQSRLLCLLPLRMVLRSVMAVEQTEQDGANLLEVAMFLDKAHIDSLRSVQKFKDQICTYLSTMDGQINKYYTSIKEQIKTFVGKQIPPNDIIDFFYTSTQFRQNQESIQKMEQYLDQFTQNYQFNDQVEIVKLNIFQGAMNQSGQKYTELQEKLNDILKEVEKKSETIKVIHFQKLKKNKNNKELYQPMQIEATVQTSSALSNPQFRFSSTLKGANITVLQNNMVAEQKGQESNGQRFIICEPAIPKTGKVVFAFRVKKYVGWVGLGVCHKNIIQTANFKFNYTTVGHGSYLISNNAYSWSHLEAALNSSNKSFDFVVGDTIYIEIDNNAKIITWKKNNTNQTFSMQIDTSQELYPCANLCSAGDTVELLQSSEVVKN